MRDKRFWASVVNILSLCVIIFFVSTYFIYDQKFIGYVIVFLGLFSLASLRLFNIKIATVKPDIIFGVIDNGILALMSVVGGEVAGVAGAVIGGVVGNAITDGIAGIFEGYWAENFAISDKRTILGSSVGKMSGCLLGAGVVLILFSLFSGRV